jgi:hypothetical protein
MTRWIERRDKLVDGTMDGAAAAARMTAARLWTATVDGSDGTAMDGGDGAEQWWLWCSGGMSKGEAAARPRAAQEDNGGVGRGEAVVRPWAARRTKAAREDNGGVRWKTNKEERKKKNLTVAALYRLEHRLIRCGRKRSSVQI